MHTETTNNLELTVGEWLKDASRSGLPRLDAEAVLAHALNKPRSWLYTWPEKNLPVAVRQKADALWKQRLNGEPLAYLTGQREFYGLKLRVTTDTLIPRPETEMLVDVILERHQQQPIHRLLDLGTGSGAIALALKTMLPESDVWATDANRAALAVARDNARRLGLPLQLACGDWFDALPSPGPRFDAILSNPPYIDPDDAHLKALKHEPLSALVADEHGLADLFFLIKKAPGHLNTGGWLLLEHGFDQGQAVREVLLKHGYQHVETHKDLAGLERISLGQWPG